MFFSDSKKRYKRLIIVIIPLFIGFVVCGFFAYKSATSLFGGPTNVLDIDSMDYHLRSNATDYQVELFNELNSLIQDGTDDLAIAESVVKNFIADAYTWNNKKGQWDVGGMYYVYSPMKANIYYKLKDRFYGLLNKYLDENKGEDLLEVESIEVESSNKQNEKFQVDGKEYDCYIIRCNWAYSATSKYNDKVDNSMTFYVIKNDDGRFEIVVNNES